MNSRNLDYIYPHNPRKHYTLADDKLKTKVLFASYGIPHPKTYGSFSSFYELTTLEQLLAKHDAFVIKPAQGSGGNGILVLESCGERQWSSPGGKRYAFDDIKKHVSDIIFGVHSLDMHDKAIVEERIIQHERIEPISPNGLADLRLILFKGTVVMAMMRVATSDSGGKANLHQGGIGIGIDIARGITTQAMCEREAFTHHPDSSHPLGGVEVPFWEKILEIAKLTAANVPLEYLGIDIAMGEKGPMVLELNVRPGIEIQNINDKGLAEPLQTVKGMER